MSKVIQRSEMYYFADGTNLSHSSNSLTQINRYMNHGLKLIDHWLRTNRISLNPNKAGLFEGSFFWRGKGGGSI